MNDVAIRVRIPGEIDARLEDLVSLMAADPSLAWGRITKSAALRLALVTGLETLEEKYGAKKRKK